MRRTRRLGLIGVLCFGALLHGQTLEQIAVDREAKLEASLERLREVRATIREERLPLARQLTALDAQADALEDEVERARRLNDSRRVELDTLREQVVGRQKEVDYVTRTLMPDYLANFDAALSPGQRQSAGERIREYNLFLEDTEATELEQLEAGLARIREAHETIQESIGGQRYGGRALTPSGTLEAGRFLQIGPLVYFASEDSPFAGIVLEARSGEAEATALNDAEAQAVAAVIEQGVGELPVDPTLGDALAVAQTRETVLEHLAKGGVWVYPILLFALVATLVAVFKAIQVFRIRHPQPMVIHDIVKYLRGGDSARAMELAKAQPQPSRDMLVGAVSHADESTEMVEEVMYESMLTTHPRLERFLNVIAVTAAAAPLLGLLGTVTGIIKTFRLMTVFGAGDPKPLISGISEALITTELGLILAIPALVLHAMLSRKVAGTMARLEKTAVTFVNGLSRSQSSPGGSA